jgi:hypothetical protein
LEARKCTLLSRGDANLLERKEGSLPTELDQVNSVTLALEEKKGNRYHLYINVLTNPSTKPRWFSGVSLCLSTAKSLYSCFCSLSLCHSTKNQVEKLLAKDLLSKLKGEVQDRLQENIYSKDYPDIQVPDYIYHKN